MSYLLLATESDQIFEEFKAVFVGDHVVHRVKSGAHVQEAMVQIEPDVLILDLRIGNMGGVATSIEIKQEMAQGRVKDAPVLLLLDREVDDYLAQQSSADAWLAKPLNPLALKRKVSELMEA